MNLTQDKPIKRSKDFPGAVDESRLETALRTSWTRQSSSDPGNWSSDNPAFAQCAATSLVVNDYLGGEIVIADANLPDGSQISHYLNRVEGVEKDFTKDQFPAGTRVVTRNYTPRGFSSTRDEMLSYGMNQVRYNILKSRVQESLR
ncbi:MAG: hypothetical protein NUV37_00580 [Nanoarchaeota archaeon]|nr:hypothetical protein [Nanoarchaeota archaeon]